MPRKPNPGTKEQQAYIRGKTEEEKKKIKAVKEICARNENLQVRDVILKGFDKFLKDHNWPPGDSQTVLEAFEVKPVMKAPVCGIHGCGKLATYKMFHEKITVHRCNAHKHAQLPWKTYGSMPIKRA